ncbi:galactose-binding domain-containing protein [Marinoscillum furvescens]|nr:discoidin domain-containing protein [Marinoscillum furvescens]
MTFSLLSAYALSAQTTVYSLDDLKPYLDDDNVHVILSPGTYTVTGAEALNGDYPDTVIMNGKTNKVLFLFKGNNSTYDFTGVTINVETSVFSSLGNYDVNEIQILGNNNVLKNLTLVDLGSVDDRPTKRAQNIVMDGSGNRIEGFHVTVKGSYPYGYGDAFGKGGSWTIKHYKHSGCLIRGESNHLKNSTFIQRSYGHCLFMQAASNPIIEGCYIEGEMRSTDDMLAETSGPAYDIDFQTVWGYRLPPGYMLSLGEGGIRAYNAGTTRIDGVEYQRGTSNPTVLNCTIKNMRTGVVLAHASGTKYVEGCSAIGCETGFSLGSNGDLVNCSADAAYGWVYKDAYDSNNGVNADITVLPPSAPYYNGSGVLAYIGGYNHNITLRSSDPNPNQGIQVMFGGDLPGIRFLNGANASQNNHTPDNVTLNNFTGFPVLLTSGSSNISGQSCGTITDNGTSNTLSQSTACNSNIALFGMASQSSTGYGGVANRAIDGDTNGKWSGNSVTHTNNEANPWWEVALDTVYSIGDINIFNRTDGCCKARLTNFTVSVINGGSTTFSQSYTSYPDPSITVDAGGAIGDVVRVQLDDTNPLSLAEVQVFESVNTITVQENETGFCGVEGTIDSNHAGHTGTGFANTTNSLGTGIDYEIDGDAGDYTLVWRYASTSDRPADLIVNSSTVASNIAFDLTGAWTSWANTAAVTVNLAAGVKTVRLEGVTSSGLANIDYMEVTGPNVAASSCTSGARKADTQPKVALSVYPNPATDVLYIDAPEQQFKHYAIFSLGGQQLRHGVLTADQQKIDVSGLTGGLYMLKLSGAATKTQMMKVVVK